MARPVLVHFGSDITDAALVTATAEATVEGVKQEPGVYIVGEHFGMWALLSQQDNPDQPVWYEYVDATDEHRALAEKFDETLTTEPVPIVGKPTYDELATAFWEYLAATNNGGDPVAGDEDDVERASLLLERTEVMNPYSGWPA
jgi:hypothetical protein